MAEDAVALYGLAKKQLESMNQREYERCPNTAFATLRTLLRDPPRLRFERHRGYGTKKLVDWPLAFPEIERSRSLEKRVWYWTG